MKSRWWIPLLLPGCSSSPKPEPKPDTYIEVDLGSFSRDLPVREEVQTFSVQVALQLHPLEGVDRYVRSRLNLLRHAALEVIQRKHPDAFLTQQFTSDFERLLLAHLNKTLSGAYESPVIQKVLFPEMKIPAK